MSGNAHANRHGHQPGCVFCEMRPKQAKAAGLYRNATGHRHNPKRKKRSRKRGLDSLLRK